MRWRCDADADCMDGTDEEDCGTGGNSSAGVTSCAGDGAEHQSSTWAWQAGCGLSQA